MQASRGVVYLVWGEKLERHLQRSIASVQAFHPELPIEVIRLPDQGPILGLQQKSTMFSRTPFAETLFLDVDTVVMDRLDFGFDKAARFGLACCICECPWARRYVGLASQRDMIEYNTGVLFFTATAQPVFAAWEQLASKIDARLPLVLADGTTGFMPYNDQCAFAAAVEESGTQPFVLPANWNYRPQFMESFFGPIKIWHAYADPPPEFGANNAQYRNPKVIIQHHRINFTIGGRDIRE